MVNGSKMVVNGGNFYVSGEIILKRENRSDDERQLLA
jgi:hypothetical protein